MQDPGEIEQAARDLAARFTDTWNRRDGAGYGLAYWPDAELVDPTGAIWDGREAIAWMHVELWRGPAHDSRVEARVRRVRELAPNVGVIDLDVTVEGFAPPGAVPGDTIETHLKHVVEKRGDKWKIIASQNTFVVPPPDL
jgi:uncharacterized protein (TIGR02246 family)